MKRKTGNTLILFMFMLLSCMLLYGCGGDKKEEAAPAATEETAILQDTEQAGQTTVENEAATTEAAPDQGTTAEDNTAAPAREAASFVGKWRFYSMESDDPSMNVKHEDLAEWKDQGFDYAEGNIITFQSDGTYAIDTFGDVTKGDWTDNGDGTGSFVFEGENYEISMEDELLVCHMKDNVTRFERME